MEYTVYAIPPGVYREAPTTGTKDDVTLRLRRIEGQIRGLQRMIEEGRDCLRGQGSKNPEAAMEEAMKLFLTLA